MKARIEDKVDGLAQLQMLNPFTKTHLNEILEFIKDHQNSDKDTFFKKLRKYFDKNQDWIDAYSKVSDLDLQKFFMSSMFSTENKEDPEIIDLNQIQIFALYCCR